jgi:hypothetical protein
MAAATDLSALHPFCRHGTAVAGIIGARDLNDLGVRGAYTASESGWLQSAAGKNSNEADAMIRGGPDVRVEQLGPAG